MSADVPTQGKTTAIPLAGFTTIAQTGAVPIMSRACDTCLGRGSTQQRVIEEDEDGIEWETLKEVPCPDCDEGKAKFDPEKDGDYDI